MKVYATGYRPKEKPTEEQQRSPYTEHEVFYSKEPHWKMGAYEAESQCKVLHSIRVHVGEHFCTFTVEELPGGEFAVVCLNHPEG